LFVSLNHKWHSRLPLVGSSGFRVHYGAEYNNRWYAVAAWSNPVARLLPQQTWIELRRFAISGKAPKNTASRMLGWMVRDIRNRFPDVERLISYQDMETHRGTIYRAVGWRQAEGYISRPRGWTGEGWNTRKRRGRTNQNVAPRMRWEKLLRRKVITALAVCQQWKRNAVGVDVRESQATLTKTRIAQRRLFE